MGTEIRGFGPIEYEGFSLTGEYHYTDAIAPRYAADPLDSDPGEGPQIEIVSVYIDGGDKKAIELVAYLVHWLDDRIAESLSVGCEADYDENAADEWRFEREAA